MSKAIAITGVLAVLSFAVLCGLLMSTPGCRAQISHMKSDIFGLKRKVTFYSMSGEVIREWTISDKVEDQGGSCRFLVNGKAVTLSGTFIIEEL